MENHVAGKISKVDHNVTQVKTQLQNLGYTVSETPQQLEFQKEGLLEAVIEEVTPICQSLGICENKDLTLEETYPDLSMTSVYDNGRIVRKLPSY